MTIARLATRTNLVSIIDGTVDDAEFDNIINELNAHTAAVNPHTQSLNKTGDTMSGGLVISIAGTSEPLRVSGAATTNSIGTLVGDSLTTGKLLNLTSNSADVSSRYLLRVLNDNALATGAVCLRLENHSTGNALDIYTGAAVTGSISTAGVCTMTSFII